MQKAGAILKIYKISFSWKEISDDAFSSKIIYFKKINKRNELNEIEKAQNNGFTS